MLKKLFYHDFRALSRYMIPTVCIVLGICLLAGIVLSIFMANAEGIYSNGYLDAFTLLDTILTLSVGLVYLFLFFGLAGAVLAFYIIYILRVRTHMYGDEGYLTLTVPATPHQFTLAKLFSGTIWFYITAIAVIIGAIISIVVPLFFLPGATGGAGSGGGTEAVAASFLEVLSVILYIFAYIFVLPVSQVMFLQTTVSFGSLLAGKSHIFASIGFYFGVNFALSTVQSLISGSIFAGAYSGAVDYGLLSFFDALVYILIYSALGIGMYFWNVHLLKNKVNLE